MIKLLWLICCIFIIFCVDVVVFAFINLIYLIFETLCAIFHFIWEFKIPKDNIWYKLFNCDLELYEDFDNFPKEYFNGVKEDFIILYNKVN